MLVDILELDGAMEDTATAPIVFSLSLAAPMLLYVAYRSLIEELSLLFQMRE